MDVIVYMIVIILAGIGFGQVTYWILKAISIALGYE